jgi:putative transposase
MPNRKIAPELLDYAKWPSVEVRRLTEDDAIRYQRLEMAIRAACDGIKSGEIEHKFGVKRNLLHYYLKKCISSHSDGRIKGFRALIVESQRSKYHRIAELNQGSDGSGLAGAFNLVLNDYPEVKAWLDQRLSPDKGTKIQAAGFTLSRIHQDFLTQLRKAGHKADEYPFTTKRHGYEALCAYVKSRIAAGDNDAARSKFGDQAVEGRGRNSAIPGLFRPVVAYERTAYDEYQFPDISTITIESDG